MTPSIFQPKRLSGALLAAALCAPSAHALDLLQTWEQARQHDPQMQVVQATRSSVQAYEAQAQSLWRPVVMGSATVGAMSADTRMQGAQFTAPGFGQSNGVSFGTSVSAATSTRWSLQAKQALYSPERQVQQAQLQHAAARIGVTCRGRTARSTSSTATANSSATSCAARPASAHRGNAPTAALTFVRFACSPTAGEVGMQDGSKRHR